MPTGGTVVVGTPQSHRGRCSYGVRKADGYFAVGAPAPGCEGAVRDNSELAIYRKAGQLFEGVTVDGGGQGLQQVACFIRILAGKVGGVFQRAAGFDGLADDIDVLHATFLNGPAYQRSEEHTS